MRWNFSWPAPSAVAIGTALFVDPATPKPDLSGTGGLHGRMKIQRVSDLVGALELPGDQPKTAPYP